MIPKIPCRNSAEPAVTTNQLCTDRSGNGIVHWLRWITSSAAVVIIVVIDNFGINAITALNDHVRRHFENKYINDQKSLLQTNAETVPPSPFI
jgi:hypothetical protein